MTMWMDKGHQVRACKLEGMRVNEVMYVHFRLRLAANWRQMSIGAATACIDEGTLHLAG